MTRRRTFRAGNSIIYIRANGQTLLGHAAKAPAQHELEKGLQSCEDVQHNMIKALSFLADTVHLNPACKNASRRRSLEQ